MYWSVFTTHKHLILYFIFGVSAALVDVGVYIFLFEAVKVPKAYIATTISIAVATIYAFLLNAIFNFKTLDNLVKRFVFFTLASFAGLLLSAATLLILTDILGFNGIIVKLGTLPFIFILQYYLNTKYSFQKTAVEDVSTKQLQVPKGSSVAVIGGGFTGLATAYRLAKAGAKVTIFERDTTVGGLAGGFTLAGYPLEKAYHFLYRTDNFILDLAKELGLKDAIKFYPSTIGFFYKGVMYPFTTALHLLKFSPLSITDRIRTGVIGLMIQTVSDWEPLQRFTAYEWLRAFFGKKVTEIVWDPLLKGKFERYYDKVTMSWLWGRIAIRAKSREATGTEKLGYVHGGFRTIVDKLVEEITARGGIIYTEVSVKCVIREKNGSVKVFIAEEIKTTFDTVVFTTPTHVAVSLLSDNPEITQEYKDKAASISYLDAVVMPFATTEPIGPHFWYNINDDRVPFLLLLSTSALTGTESFDGKHIYYIGAYVHHDHRYMTMPEETLKQEWYDGLKVMFPDFDRSTVIDDALFRLKDAQHIVDIGFRENKILPYETPVKGIFLSNFTQIYPDDRGTNFAVREGHVIAGIVAEYLIQKKSPEISIILPTFNEAGNVEPMVGAIRATLDPIGTNYEIIYVDDSSDETPKIIKRLAHRDSRIHLIHRPVEERTGLATAFIEGFAQARAPYICCMDADLQHPPSIIPEMLAMLKGGNTTLVVASRFVAGGVDRGLSEIHRKIITWVFRFVTWTILPPTRKTTDPMTGYFMFKRSYIKDRNDLKPLGFKILVELLARVPKFTVKEIPLKFQPRLAGETKASAKQAIVFFKHLVCLALSVPSSAQLLWLSFSSALVVAPLIAYLVYTGGETLSAATSFGVSIGLVLLCIGPLSTLVFVIQKNVQALYLIIRYIKSQKT